MERKYIFELLADFDAPDYKGLQAHGSRMILDTIPVQRSSREWKVRRVSQTWIAPAVKGNPSNNDYPCVDLAIPAFSDRAIQTLNGFLEPNGEILPLKTERGLFFAYNTTTVADVLDDKESVLKLARDGVTAARIDKWVFKQDEIARLGLSIFRIPQKPSKVLVTDIFVDCVTTHELRGFVFKAM